MKYVDEFRDPEAAKKLLRAIEANAAKLDGPIALMEVCGGHTHTIYATGWRTCCRRTSSWSTAPVARCA